MLDKFILIKSGIYAATIRDRKQKVSFKDTVMGRVIDLVTDKKNNTTLTVELVYGSGICYSRKEYNGSTRSRVTFFMNQSEAYHDGIVNRIWRNIVKKKDPNLQESFLIKHNDNIISETPYRHDLDKMLATGGHTKIYNFKSSISIEEKDLVPIINDKIKNVAIAKALATKLNTTLADTTDFENDDDDSIRFNLTRFDFYRHIEGRMIIQTHNIESLESDLQALYVKYNVAIDSFSQPVELDLGSSTQLSYNVEDLQVEAVKHNVDINQALQEKRGFITGKKFGI